MAVTSCSKDDDPAVRTSQAQIIFLFSPGGLGDMSYNDCILQGVQRFKSEHPDTDIYIYSPGALDEAEKIFTDWLVRPESDNPVLFVLGTSDYEPIADRYLRDHSLSANKCEGVPGMLFITAANGDETSKADVFNSDMRIWMSNRFTSTFIEQIAANQSIAMRDLYYRLFINTVGSHVMVYNDQNYGNLYTSDMSEFVNFKQ